MAITRRQFVTRLGTLAAAVGMSQAEMSRVVGAFGAIDPTKSFGGTLHKPVVVWIHGAECTGCSTSLLSFLENAGGKPIYGDSTTSTLDALLAAGLDAAAPLTLTGGLRVDADVAGVPMLNIADVVIDVIDLQYHETVMGQAGDLAAQWLKDFETNGLGAGKTGFVLVVEGALQKINGNSAWDPTGTYAGHVPWCSIGMSDDWDAENPTTSPGFEHDMPEVVTTLAEAANCLAVLPVGQCACYGGYPGCKPALASDEFDVKLSQTGAQGVYDYLADHGTLGAEGKVINSPGCPTNPFWLVLTIIQTMIAAQGGAPGVAALVAGVDSGRRVKSAYPIPVHSAYCPRYKYYTKGIYASKPGQVGCLQKIGCKGLYTRSLCGVHGWNNMQPQNGAAQTFVGAKGGSHCTSSGHPCMGCTEPGYPDRFVPFVKL
ncbi:MAG: hypothetical protein U1E26_07560 [Coriobacteriia bacterium]|nr:hypothetical protein [Coriobacteriia bacterium]